MGRKTEIEAILSALDPVLEPFGLRRRKKTQEWARSPDDLHRDLVHINFGLAALSPSVAVEYRDIAGLVPREVGSCHASVMLESLVSRRGGYDFATPVAELAGDIISYGVPFFDKLHDRQWVIERLSDDSPSAWCVPSYSERIRLLPLLLTRLGRVSDALRFVERVLPEARQRDQRVPGYGHFADWFRVSFSA